MTDALFMTIACRPEWPTNQVLSPEDVHLDISLSRQFEFHPQLKTTIEKIRNIILHELAIPHIVNYHRRFSQIKPYHPFQDNLTSQVRYTDPIVLVDGLHRPVGTDQIRASFIDVVPGMSGI